MSYFKAKMHQIRFRLELHTDPAGELTALARPSNWIWEALHLREGNGREEKRKGKKRKKVGGEGGKKVGGKGCGEGRGEKVASWLWGMDAPERTCVI